MPAGSDIIKEFLVALSWSHDETSRKKVVQAEAKTTKELEGEQKKREVIAKKRKDDVLATIAGFAKITAAAEAMAIGVAASVERIARSFEKVYYSSQRTGASVKELNAFGYAASQVGSSAEEAQAAVEGLAKAQREMPGYAGMLTKLGASDPKNVVKSLTEIMPRLAAMPMATAEAYSKVLGIPEHLLLAMHDNMEEFKKFQAESNAKYNLLGFDPEKAAKDGQALTRLFRGLYDTVEKLTEAIGSQLFVDLKGPIEDLNAYLLAHGKEISDIVSKIATAFVDMLKFLVENLPKLDRFAESMGGWNRALEALGVIVTGAYVANFTKLFLALSGIAALSMPAWALAFLGVAGAVEVGKQAKQMHVGPLTPQEAKTRREGTQRFDDSGWNPLNWFRPSWWKKGNRGGGGGGDTPDTAVGPVGPSGTYRPKYKLSDADLNDSVIAKINGEATSSQTSTDAVINNMFNRLGTKTYGPSGNLTQVAFAPSQYTGYRRADAKRAEYIRSRIRAIADGSVPDNTHGSNEYRASYYYGPWTQHHANAPVIGGNRFAYNPAGGRGPYAAYDKPNLVKTPPMLKGGHASLQDHSGVKAHMPVMANPFGDFAAKLRTQMGAAHPLGGAPTDSSRNVQLHQTNHVSVQGVSDPTAAAAQIGARQDKHSSLLLRSMQSAIG